MTNPRNVVVTGGGTGIGYAVAAAFVAAGDAVSITGRRTDVLGAAAERLGAAAVPFDAADPTAVTAALDRLPSEVDVLVNNAGGNTDRRRAAPPADLAELAESWRTNLDANVLSVVLVTAALAPRLRAGARVVTIGSIAGATGGGSYAAAKAALESWSRGQAAELGPRGVTVNVVAPGLVTDTEFFGDTLTEERRDRLVRATATGRAGVPDDVVAAVRFLTAPAAGHVTGQVLHVNGGALGSR